MEKKQLENNSRTELLLGSQGLERLHNSHVMIVGLGGVGGYALEQLVRAGVGKFTLVDNDKISESNVNRQLIADYKSLGKYKVDVFTERIKLINPNAEVSVFKTFIDSENIPSLLTNANPDYLIDAIDTLRPKVALIVNCLRFNIRVISALGAGGKLNPEMVRTTDISETYNDGLARMLRKRLHKQGIYTGFKAVFSPEDIPQSAVIQERGQNKRTNVGTISYMPAIFGMHCAATVVRDLIQDV